MSTNSMPERIEREKRNQQCQLRTSWPLYIYIRAWERQSCGSVELRDYLREVWRSAGHATAVVR